MARHHETEQAIHRARLAGVSPVIKPQSIPCLRLNTSTTSRPCATLEANISIALRSAVNSTISAQAAVTRSASFTSASTSSLMNSPARMCRPPKSARFTPALDISGLKIAVANEFLDADLVAHVVQKMFRRTDHAGIEAKWSSGETDHAHVRIDDFAVGQELAIHPVAGLAYKMGFVYHDQIEWIEIARSLVDALNAGDKNWCGGITPSSNLPNTRPTLIAGHSRRTLSAFCSSNSLTWAKISTRPLHCVTASEAILARTRLLPAPVGKNCDWVIVAVSQVIVDRIDGGLLVGTQLHEITSPLCRLTPRTTRTNPGSEFFQDVHSRTHRRLPGPSESNSWSHRKQMR